MGRDEGSRPGCGMAACSLKPLSGARVPLSLSIYEVCLASFLKPEIRRRLGFQELYGCVSHRYQES
jgi:hypothetical protein